MLNSIHNTLEKGRFRWEGEEVILKDNYWGDDISIAYGLIAYVDGDDIVKGECLGSFRFGILMEKVILTCNSCSLLKEPNTVIAWLIHNICYKIIGFNIKVKEIGQL